MSSVTVAVVNPNQLNYELIRYYLQKKPKMLEHASAFSPSPARTDRYFVPFLKTDTGSLS